MEPHAMSYHSQGLIRGLAILRLLGRADAPLTLARIAQSLELPKSTVVRLLMVMTEEGFVRRFAEGPSYSIGHAVRETAEGYRPPSIAEVTAAELKRIADEIGFTTNIGILDGRFVLHLHVEEPERPLRFAASGMHDAAYCTGLGKLLLSMLPAERIDAHLPDAEPYTAWTPSTLVTRDALLVELEGIRERGYSVDDEERNLGVTCMAVAIPAGGPPGVALSVSAPSAELAGPDRERLLPVLRAAAAGLAALPGFDHALAAFRPPDADRRG